MNAFLIINAHLSSALKKLATFLCLSKLNSTLALGAPCDIMTDLKSARVSKQGSRSIYKYMHYCCSSSSLSLSIVLRSHTSLYKLYKPSITMSSWVITGVSRGLGVRFHPCFMHRSRVTNIHTSSSSSSSSASCLKTQTTQFLASSATKLPSSLRLPLKSAGEIFTSFRPTQRTRWHWR